MNKFAKNFSVLVSGSAIAQLIGFLLMPVLSRMYTHAAFGLFANFQSLLSIIFSIGILGYNVPIIIEQNEQKAKAVVKLSIALSVCLSALTSIILLLPIKYFDIYNKIQFLIGVAVFLQLMNLIYTQWNIRQQRFKLNAAYMIIQNVAIFLSQWAFFKIYPTYGLAIGLTLGYFISNIYMAFKLKLSTKGISVNEIKDVAKRYVDFPKYFAPANVLDSLSANIPVLLLTTHFSLSEIGFYGIAYKLLMQPIVLISSNMNSIMISDMSIRKNNGIPIWDKYKKIFVLLFLSGLIGSLLILFAGPELFSFIFGKEWEDAGFVAMALCPLSVGMIVKGLGNAAVRVFEKQKYMLRYAVVSFVLRFLSLIISIHFIQDFNTILLIYSIIAFCVIMGGELYLCYCVKKYDISLIKK
jgi:O-antigen/teichoic acid export membrane protein